MDLHEENKLLFSESDLYRGLRLPLIGSKEKVDSLLKKQILGNSEEELAENYPLIVLQAITSHEDAMITDQEETKIDISRLPDCNPFQDPDAIFVGGIRVTVSIPFTGDPQFWIKKPSSCGERTWFRKFQI